MKTRSSAGAAACRLVMALPLAPLALAAHGAPGFAGPSLAQTAQRAAFVGQGFQPNAALSVSVTAPGGTEAVYGAVSDAKGVLRYELTPQQPGTYRLRVLDSGGRVLRETRLHVRR